MEAGKTTSAPRGWHIGSWDICAKNSMPIPLHFSCAQHSDLSVQPDALDFQKGIKPVALSFKSSRNADFGPEGGRISKAYRRHEAPH